MVELRKYGKSILHSFYSFVPLIIIDKKANFYFGIMNLIILIKKPALPLKFCV